MSDHSIIPMSAAPRRVQCAGSAIMEAMHPETEVNEAAEEGTASHELAEQMIDSMTRGGVGFPTPDQVVGQTASNGVIWTQDSYDGALMYAEDCQRIMQKTSVFGGPNLMIERKVEAHRIHPESYGTLDFAIVDHKALTVHVTDYKFGHRVVDAYENWQLIEYGVAVIDEITGGNGLEDQYWKIIFTVIQPRAPHRDGPIRRWEVRACDLRPYANYLHTVEHEALGPDPKCVTGPQCKDCSARYNCDTLMEGGAAEAAYVGKPFSVNRTPDELALEIKMLRQAKSVVESRLNGIEAQAEQMIRQGTSVPGFALEAGQGRQKWAMSNQEVFSLGGMMGIDLRKPAEPVTPKQAIAKGLDKQTINPLTTTPSTSTKLVESTKTTAAAVFRKRNDNHDHE